MGTCLLASVSARTLLIGTPVVLVPIPALAACLPTNTPASGTTVTCGPGEDTSGVTGGASNLTVTAETTTRPTSTATSRGGVHAERVGHRRLGEQ